MRWASSRLPLAGAIVAAVAVAVAMLVGPFERYPYRDVERLRVASERVARVCSRSADEETLVRDADVIASLVARHPHQPIALDGGGLITTPARVQQQLVTTLARHEEDSRCGPVAARLAARLRERA